MLWLKSANKKNRNKLQDQLAKWAVKSDWIQNRLVTFNVPRRLSKIQCLTTFTWINHHTRQESVLLRITSNRFLIHLRINSISWTTISRTLTLLVMWTSMKARIMRRCLFKCSKAIMRLLQGHQSRTTRGLCFLK